jgi:adenosylcobinamide-phosphate synthase
MSFISIMFALLLEQARPLAQLNPVHNANRGWVRWVVISFDAGKKHHGWLVWCVTVLVPAVLACAIHWALLETLGWIAAILWNVAVLYVTLGFRQFSHHFTQIRDALYAGDEALARQKLAQWMRMDVSELPRSEIVRHVIEYSVLSAHRHVFGVLAWYSLLAALGLGPAGAVIYRISEYLSRWVSRPMRVDSTPVSDSLKAFCAKAWHGIDWFPVRITAVGFAFVGSFEDAIESWRRHDARAPDDNDGVVLAATAGAVNVRLGSGVDHASGEVPQMTHLRSVVGLVWRTVVMWMVVLLLLTLARLLG